MENTEQTTFHSKAEVSTQGWDELAKEKGIQQEQPVIEGKVATADDLGAFSEDPVKKAAEKKAAEDKVKEAEQKAQSVADQAKDKAEGLVDQVKNMSVDDVKQKAGEVVDAAKAKAGEILPGKGEAKEESGEKGEGFFAGIKAKAGELLQSGKDLVNSVIHPEDKKKAEEEARREAEDAAEGFKKVTQGAKPEDVNDVKKSEGEDKPASEKTQNVFDALGGEVKDQSEADSSKQAGSTGIIGTAKNVIGTVEHTIADAAHFVKEAIVGEGELDSAKLGDGSH